MSRNQRWRKAASKGREQTWAQEAPKILADIEIPEVCGAKISIFNQRDHQVWDKTYLLIPEIPLKTTLHQ